MNTGAWAGSRAGTLLLLVVFTAGCGGETGDEGAATTSSPGVQPTSTVSEGTVAPTTSVPNPVADGEALKAGKCTLTTSGDRQDSWSFEQVPTSFGSDYWLSEEELRGAVEFLGEDIAGGSYDELVASGRPIVTFLSISCADPDNLIQGAFLTHTNATLSSDLPMGPGSYPIEGGLFDADGPAGTMIAEFTVSEDELYGTGSGSLEITSWDRDAIEGSFSFPAREIFTEAEPREVEVTVQFSFVCKEWFSGC